MLSSCIANLVTTHVALNPPSYKHSITYAAAATVPWLRLINNLLDYGDKSVVKEFADQCRDHVQAYHAFNVPPLPLYSRKSNDTARH